MDTQHDIVPDADIAARYLQPRTWLPEAFAIAAIFAVLWIVLALHMLRDGLAW